MADERAEEGVQHVRTAFLVVQGTDGDWRAVPDPATPLKPDRPPTVGEMKSGCAEVVSDIEASKISAMMLAQFMQLTAQMRQQTEAQDLAARLKI